MTNTELARRQERAANEALIIGEIEDGFRVYSPTNAKHPYVVAGTREEPTCTCPDFQGHASDPNWRCKHILAVEQHITGGNGAPRPDAVETEERRAIQEESRPLRSRQPVKATAKSNGNGVAQMLLKRSVSPDGRIDSLSVEFTCPVDDTRGDTVTAKATEILSVQSAIVDQFLNGNGKPNGTSPPSQERGSAVPARLVGIGGMEGKWGRRLFLTIQANGKNLRFYGTRDQLISAITAAGFPEATHSAAEGVSLNLPCRIVTKPSDDGRFVNVERILPAETSSGLSRV